MNTPNVYTGIAVGGTLEGKNISSPAPRWIRQLAHDDHEGRVVVAHEVYEYDPIIHRNPEWIPLSSGIFWHSDIPADERILYLITRFSKMADRIRTQCYPCRYEWELS